MDLPEVEQLMDLIKDEPDQERYVALSTETQQEIQDLERVISENQTDTSSLFTRMEDVQRLLDALQQQTYLCEISDKKS